MRRVESLSLRELIVELAQIEDALRVDDQRGKRGATSSPAVRESLLHERGLAIVDELRGRSRPTDITRCP